MLALLGLLGPLRVWASAVEPSVALHYGAAPPWSELAAFDWVVLEPGHHGNIKARAEAAPRTRFFAYLSVGEVEKGHRLQATIPAAWLMGANRPWNSKVIDQRAADWPRWFVEHVARPQWDRGYRGFFLDTLDSYQLVAKTPEERGAHEAGLVRVIKALKVAFPEARLIVNRGFEILPHVASEVSMVAAESLYRGWDQGARRYVTVSDPDRAWLLERLEKVRTQHRLPILAIDYVAPAERVLARETARRIRDHGFVPWVTASDLEGLGVGALEVLPRRLIVLHDATVGADVAELTHAGALRFLGAPAYHLGLVPEFINPDERELPPLRAGEVAGVVTQFMHDRPRPEMAAWLRGAMSLGIKVASLGQPGLSDARAVRDTFGFRVSDGDVKPVSPVAFSKKDPSIGFEITPVPGVLDFHALTAPQGSDVLLQVRDGRGALMDAVAVTPWGGYALTGYNVVRMTAGENIYRWVIDPIAFLRRALALPAMPVPDVTTETGRRILMIHIDGDGFANRSDLPGSPLGSEVLLRNVLERYRLPTAMSVIEGEISPQGLHPRLSAEMEGIARRMFALPHVEIGSHTYSHPFDWVQAEKGSQDKSYALDLPGYRFDADREISGSIAYIQSRLAPAGKPVVLFQWSGDCNPSDKTLAALEKTGVLAINGGDTITTHAQNSMTLVAPLGVRKGPFFQVYAPNQNENVYTQHFSGPLYGYERVIETFKLTEQPYRLKPVNIYYHTYSASRKASLEALHRVYRWALGQPLHPIYPSDYVRKAMNYEEIVVARGDGGFLVRGARHVRELRAPHSMGVAQIQDSRGVVGATVGGREQYVHLSDSEAWIPFAAKADASAQLVDANARVVSMERGPGRTQLQLLSHAPLRMSIRHPAGCPITLGGKRINPVGGGADGTYQYASDKHGTETLTIGCP